MKRVASQTESFGRTMAVQGIAQERMSEFRHVKTDLVHAACGDTDTKRGADRSFVFKRSAAGRRG